jgi:hypothetical protein
MTISITCSVGVVFFTVAGCRRNRKSYQQSDPACTSRRQTRLGPSPVTVSCTHMAVVRTCFHVRSRLDQEASAAAKCCQKMRSVGSLKGKSQLLFGLPNRNMQTLILCRESSISAHINSTVF